MRREVVRLKTSAQEYIKRYAQFYERWAINEKSREKALSDLSEIKNKKLQKLETREKTLLARTPKLFTEAW